MSESRLGGRQVLFGDRLLRFREEIIAAAMIVGHKGTNGRHG
jgi:hypothetical protein